LTGENLNFGAQRPLAAGDEIGAVGRIAADAQEKGKI